MYQRFGLSVLGCLLLVGWANGQQAALLNEWDAIFLNDAKVGYVHSLTDKVETSGQMVVHSRMKSEMTVRRFDDRLKIATLTDAFELADGRLYAIDSRIQMANTIRRTQGRLGNDRRFHLTIQDGNQKRTETIEWADDVHGPYSHEQSLRDKPMKPGETRSMKVFLPELNVVAIRTLKALDFEDVHLHDGTSKKLLAIEDRNDKIPQVGKIWTDEKGVVLKSEMPFGDLVLNAYRVTEAVAMGKPDDQGIDIGYQTLVRPDRPIPKAHDTAAVTYRLVFSDEDAAKAIPEAPYQQVLSRTEKEVRIRVSRREPSPNGDVSADPGSEFLESNGFIQADDPQIVAQAKQTTEGIDDPWKKVQALEKWVDQNMSNRDFTIAFADAKEVIRTRQGDCTEHAVLLAALCRAVGIPSRVAMGLVYLEGNGSFGYHMWTEVFVHGQWYAADGTLGQGAVAGGHIKIADGSLKGASALSTLLPIFRVIGKMNIHVEEIR